MENVEDVYALAPIQEGLVYHTIQAPESGVFVDQVGCVIEGDFDVDVFRRAWDLLVARHTALRTCFLWDGLDEPLQVVRQQVDVPWLEEDWRSLTPEERDVRLDTVLTADRRQGFGLDEAPLLRMRLLRIGERKWRWLWTFHHLISDGWSTSIIANEAFTAYEALFRGQQPAFAPAFNYRDYIAWHAEQGRAAADAEAFWRKELAGFVTPGRLQPPGARDNGGSSRHEQVELRATSADTQSLVSLASGCRVTLNTLVQAAWGLLLSKHLRDDDVVFGVTMSGRPPQLPNVEHGVGLFINTLPLRQVIDPALPLRQWLTQLQHKHFALLNWQSTALVDIQRWSGSAPGQALFDNILVFENYPAAQRADNDSTLRVGRLEISEHSNYPLAILVVPDEMLRCIAVFDTQRFDAAYVTRLLQGLLNVLASFAADPDKALGEHCLIEKSKVDQADRRGGAASPPARPHSTVVQQIADSAARHPEHIAVESAQDSLSYRALHERAERIAGALRDRGVTRGTFVGIYANRCVDMVVAILGVLRAGAAYVPMDTKYPQAHARHVVRDAGLEWVLTTAGVLEQAPELGAKVLTIDALAADITRASDPDGVVPGPDDPAYVIYTSGSTGTPKGVVVSHANLLISNGTRIDYYGEAGRFLLQSSFAFDSSIAGIFWTLATGGTLVLSVDGIEQDMHRLLAFMGEHTVSHTLCLPSLYELMLDNAQSGQLNALRTVIVAGEACSPAVVRRHFDTLPDVGLFNEYGPTEATVWSTVHRVVRNDADGEVPIGAPVDGVELWLLDQHGQPVPPGVAGEVYLGGPALAQGYLNQPGLTADRFAGMAPGGRAGRRLYRTGDLAWRREDGSLMFLGRCDGQVKIRGYRVELAGIEQVLKSHPAIADSAVALSEPSDRRARSRIVAFLAAHTGALSDQVIADDIRRFLAERLPDYMLPDSFMVLPAMPKLPNGKTDYRALPVAEATVSRNRGQGRPPSTDDEITLAGIWTELMGLDTVSVDDSFFELGGDSIISIQMISRARQAGVHIEPKDLIRHPTIAALAQLSAHSAGSPDSQDVATGDVTLMPIQAWFFEQEMARTEHWNLSALFELPSDANAAALVKALHACWRHHDALRTRFFFEQGRWRAAIEEYDANNLSHLFQDVDLRHLADATSVEQSMQARAAEVQAGFDLAAGPLFRAVLFRMPGGMGDRLLLAVHHLVIDAVSWSILIQDIETAYTQILQDQGVELPSKTTSIRAWSSFLAAEACSDRLADELAYWNRPFDISSSELPADLEDTGCGTEASTETLDIWLDQERTVQLLAGANEAYATRVDELLITALAVAFRRQTGKPALRLDLEWHGRDSSADGMDASRTLGWFTASYPVMLGLDGHDDWPSTIKSIKQQLRTVPRNGLGYGMLRYLRDAAVDGIAISDHPPPSILFNYLGRVFATDKGSLLRRISGADESSRSPDNVRIHRLEINAFIEADRLRVRVAFSSACHHRATVQYLADQLLTELQALIDHCVLPSSAGYTPSDFPDVEMSQDDLDDFLDELG